MKPNETDIYIKVREGTVAQTKPMCNKVNIDVDKDGNIVGIEVLGAIDIKINGQEGVCTIHTHTDQPG